MGDVSVTDLFKKDFKCWGAVRFIVVNAPFSNDLIFN